MTPIPRGRWADLPSSRSDADTPAVLDLLTAAGGRADGRAHPRVLRVEAPATTRSAPAPVWSPRRTAGWLAGAPVPALGVRARRTWSGAVRAVDTATHPDVQGRGLSSAGLTRSCWSEIAADTELVFNTPNGNSLPGYLRMGWREVGQVPIALHPIRPIAFARGRTGGAARRPSGTGVGSGRLHGGDRSPTGSPGRAPASPSCCASGPPRTPPTPGLDAAAAPRTSCGGGTATRRASTTGWSRRTGRRVRRAGVRPAAAARAAGRVHAVADVIVRPGDRGSARPAVLKEAARCPAATTSRRISRPARRRRGGPLRGLRYAAAHRHGAGRPRTVRPLPAARSVTDWQLSLGDLEVF